MENILIHIKGKAPIAYKEFQEFVHQSMGVFMNFHHITLEIMPKTLSIGLFLAYFEAQNIEFSLGGTDENIIFDEISKTFDEYEKVISHYS